MIIYYKDLLKDVIKQKKKGSTNRFVKLLQWYMNDTSPDKELDSMLLTLYK